MCFINDYDWYAAVSEASISPATARTRCDECHRFVEIGQPLHHVFQQEREECNACLNNDCDCPKDADGDCLDCQCEQPDYGETFDYDCCQDCDLFLKAIQAAEIAAGCALSESQPPLMEMIDQIQEAGMAESVKYFTTALKRSPELKSNGYLAWLWCKVFYHGDKPTRRRV